MLRRLAFVIGLLFLCFGGENENCIAQTLESELLALPLQELADEARERGDARRGAILFHQPTMACTKCHAVDGRENSLGPDLTNLPAEVTDQHLIESVLRPSKVIRKGFAATTLLLANGRTVTGLAVPDGENETAVRLRDASSGRVTTYRSADIEENAPSPLSIMPAQQINQLAGRQQFDDLIAYLIAIRDGGVSRASELQPSAAQYALRIPKYEEHVDHAGLLRDLDDDAFDRGQAIYQRLCINCHGDHDRPGSLPTALRFAEGRFKNGNDPFTMYQTLTRGFGFMVPQAWMVPQQKYDVIHYIRQAYLRGKNAKQFFAVTDDYLEGLPTGNTRGPKPRKLEPWSDMDYGPQLVGTYQIPGSTENFAYKGIAVRLDPGAGGVSRGSAWAIFDHDTLRMAGAWTADSDSSQRFIDWQGINFDGRHNAHPRIVGEILLSNPIGPGWANPQTGSFADDRRTMGRDGKHYGPLPRDWAQFHGFYAHEDRTILSYSVGETDILEMPGLQSVGRTSQAVRAGLEIDPKSLKVRSQQSYVMTRAFNVGPRPQPLTMRLAADAESIEAGLSTSDPRIVLRTDTGQSLLEIAAGDEPLQFVLWTGSRSDFNDGSPLARDDIRVDDPAPDLSTLISGSRPRWPERITSLLRVDDPGGPFAVDELERPINNPWLARTRLTGLDFFDDPDKLVVISWDGDVWLVTGLASVEGADLSKRVELEWQRIASGLFQPLGVKVVNGDIYVTCRDQLVILRDRNGDGETDFYECFNNDHQVTEHFHAFAMGLQVDEAGNFYYAKSARHALTAIVPHHGTLLRITPDGQRTEILANGFRAANGVCLNPDGTFIVTDQEGHWNPKNRINWVTPGVGSDMRFYGNMFGYHNVTDTSDSVMEKPLCWITNAFDRSPAELLWVDSERWGPLNGALLNFSYGYGKVYVVPHEEVGGQKQGGMCALPIDSLPTGIMRGRFSPHDGHLYTCGMFAWASSQQSQEGGLYRIRATGEVSYLPIGLEARQGEIEIELTDSINHESGADPDNYAVRIWSLKRTENYGSDHYNERGLEVARASVSQDGRHIVLTIPDLVPTRGMEIRCLLTGADGQSVERVIHSTIHRFPE